MQKLEFQSKENSLETRSIIDALDTEIARLKEARRLLAVVGEGAATVSGLKTKKRAKRRLSPEARAKIAAAQRKRWAAAKRAK